MPSAGIKPGNVPTSRVGPILDSLIRERWPYGGGHEILAEKVGCEQSTIATIIEQQWEGVEFDLADSLLCALGRWDIWHGALEDIYPTKFMETCSLSSCGKRFPEFVSGPYRKRYCSDKCRNLAAHVRDGRVTGKRLRQKGKCYQGHPLRDNNIYIYPSGQKGCKTCRVRHSRAYRARKREEAARAA